MKESILASFIILKIRAFFCETSLDIMDGPIPYVKKVNNDPDIVKAMKIVPATSLFKKYNIIILNIKEVKPIIKVPLIWGIIFFFMLFFKFPEGIMYDAEIIHSLEKMVRASVVG